MQQFRTSSRSVLDTIILRFNFKTKFFKFTKAGSHCRISVRVHVLKPEHPIIVWWSLCVDLGHQVGRTYTAIKFHNQILIRLLYVSSLNVYLARQFVIGVGSSPLALRQPLLWFPNLIPRPTGRIALPWPNAPTLISQHYTDITKDTIEIPNCNIKLVVTSHLPGQIAQLINSIFPSHTIKLSILISELSFISQIGNSADPYQPASVEAGWYGSTLFAKMYHYRSQLDKGLMVVNKRLTKDDLMRVIIN